MKLGDLKTGQVVTFRNGMHGIVFRNAVNAYKEFPSGDNYILFENGGTINLKFYEDDLTCCDTYYAEYDVCRVEELNSIKDAFGPYYVPCGEPVWERGVINA